MKYNTKILEKLENEVSEDILRQIEKAFIDCKWYKGETAMRSFLFKSGQDQLWNYFVKTYKGILNYSLVDVLYRLPKEAEEKELSLAFQRGYKNYIKNKELDYIWKIDFIVFDDYEIIFNQVKHSISKFRWEEDARRDMETFSHCLGELSDKWFDFGDRKLTYKYITYLGDIKKEFTYNLLTGGRA